MLYGILRLVVVDKIGRGEDSTDKISGIKILLPSNPPRLVPPSFEGQSLRTGLFVRVCIFRRKMRTFGSRNNNPDTDIDSMGYLMQQQNQAMRVGNVARFSELSGILQRKLENPKSVKYKVEKFVELKVHAELQDDKTLKWKWNTVYQMSDLTEDPKSSNTLYPAPSDIFNLDEVGDFRQGFFDIDEKAIPVEKHQEVFLSQFKATEKAKRAERGSAIGNLWKLVQLDTVNELENSDEEGVLLNAKVRFPEPDFFTELIGHHPELAFEQLEEYYSGMLNDEVNEDGVFEIGHLYGAAQAVANGENLFINCNCGRSEKSCHCTWIKNKVTEIARRVKSKQLNEKGI